jgi:tRNA threonylcarbamoyladenosine biosynthesis protein TsaE
MINVELKGEQQQVAFGACLSKAVGDKALIFLRGDLGAGKTTLVRGFLQARGHQGNVKSPTYTLIEPYELPGGLCYHLDLYRLGDGEELEYLGLREMLAEQAVLLVEWPQRGHGWLPPPDLQVEIEHAGESRIVHLSASTQEGEKILSRISLDNFV